ITILHTILTYQNASNAAINFSKSQSFPLSNNPDANLKTHLTDTLQFEWVDDQSPTGVRYLGFPVTFNNAQTDAFYDTILKNIQRHIQIHSQRGLSVRGKAVVLNSLILSRL
ncbi:hypothetical protein B0O80DRAFT_389151, partial [Mortierella sp. GBAus27b]